MGPERSPKGRAARQVAGPSPGPAAPAPWHHRIAEIVGTRVGAEPGRIVAVTLVLTLLATYAASGLEREPGFLSVLPDSEETDAFFRAADAFETTEFTFYVFESPDGDLLTGAGVSELLDFEDRVQSTASVRDHLADSARGAVLNPARGPILLAAAANGERDPRTLDLAEYARGLPAEDVQRAFAAFYAGPVFLPADLLDEVRASLARPFDATPTFAPSWRLADPDPAGDAPAPHLDLLGMTVHETPGSLALAFHVDSLAGVPTAQGSDVRYLLSATNPAALAPGGPGPLEFALGARFSGDGAAARATPYLAYPAPAAAGGGTTPVERPVNGTVTVEPSAAGDVVEVTFPRGDLVAAGVLPLLPFREGDWLVGTAWDAPHVEAVQAAQPLPEGPSPAPGLPPIGEAQEAARATGDRWPDEGDGVPRRDHRVALEGLHAPSVVVTLLVDTEFGGTSTENQERVAAVQEEAYGLAQEASAGPVSFLGPSATWKRVEVEEQKVQSRSTWALVAVAAILLLVFRRALDVVLSIAALGIMLAWTFGFAALAGFKLNVATAIAPFVLIGVGVDYSIHTLRHLTEGRARGLARENLVIWALRVVGTALVLATVTTMIGFLANLFSRIHGFRTFGVLTAAGILFALVVNATFVPAVRLLVGRRRARAGKPPVVRGIARGRGAGPIARVVGAARRRPLLSLSVALILALGGVAAFPALGTSYDYTGQLPADAPPTRAHQALTSGFGLLSERSFLLVEGEVATGEALRAVDEATRRIAAAELPGPSQVESLASVMRKAGNASSWFHDEAAARLIAPRDADGDGLPDVEVPAVVDRLRAAFPVEMGLLAHHDGTRYDATAIVLRTNSIDVDEHRVAWEALRAAEPPLQDAGLEATATGLPVTEVIANDAIIDSVLLITAGVVGSSLVLLGATYWFLARSALLGALVTLPVVFALAWTILLAWLLGIHLNAVTSIVGAVLVGLGIDYSIHYAQRYVEERRGGRGVEEAHRETVASTGLNLSASVVTTMASLSILLVSPQRLFLEFGILLAAGLLFALITALVVMPALLDLWERARPRFAEGPR